MSCWKLRMWGMKETHHFSWVRDKAGPHLGSVTMQNHSALHTRLYLQEKYRNTLCASKIRSMLEGPRGWKYWYTETVGKEQSSVSRVCIAVDFLPLIKYLIKAEVDMCRRLVSSSAFSCKLPDLHDSEKWEQNHSVVLEIHQRRSTHSFRHLGTR